mgnify:CR=1 FL=1
MIVLLIAVIFFLALMMALATIGSMFHRYGGKMMAALKLEHQPLMYKEVEMFRYAPMRDARRAHPPRLSTPRSPSTMQQAA